MTKLARTTRDAVASDEPSTNLHSHSARDQAFTGSSKSIPKQIKHCSAPEPAAQLQEDSCRDHERERLYGRQQQASHESAALVLLCCVAAESVHL